jgi:hypothetical protein
MRLLNLLPSLHAGLAYSEEDRLREELSRERLENTRLRLALARAEQDAERSAQALADFRTGIRAAHAELRAQVSGSSGAAA